MSLTRTQSRLINHTQSSKLLRSTWSLQYILPPLDLTSIGKLEAIRSGVNAVLVHVIHHGRHPDYNDGYHLSTNGVCGIQNFRSEFGDWEVPDGDSLILHPTLVCTFDTEEEAGLFGDNLPTQSFDGVNKGIDIDGLTIADLEMDT